MNRASFFGWMAKAAAIAPFAGVLATKFGAPSAGQIGTFAAVEGEPYAVSDAVFDGPVADETWHVFAGVSSRGNYFQTSIIKGVPAAESIAQHAEEGFDRFEIWVGGYVRYQGPTIAGRVPVGWDSLDHEGWLPNISVPALHLTAHPVW